MEPTHPPTAAMANTLTWKCAVEDGGTITLLAADLAKTKPLAPGAWCE